MINDIILRWVTTLLFAFAAAQCVYLIAAKRMGWQAYIGHGLHLVMSVAMALMAWPFSMEWPTVGPMIFFIVAAVWFLATIAIPATGSDPDECGCVPPTSSSFGRAAALYHATMMGAMAWMYAVMNGGLLPGHDSVNASGALAMGESPMLLAHGHDSEMPGMDMDMTHGAQPAYVTPVNWILALGFAIATAVWLYLYLQQRRKPGAPRDALSFAGDLCQVFMAAGMSIMFFVMA